MKVLKSYLLLISFISVNSFMFAQVGINTENPAVTLDVVAASTGTGTAEGIIAPRLTGDQLVAKNAQYAVAQNGAIVYVTAAATTPIGKVKNITVAGYYYYDAKADNGAGANSGLWLSLGGTKKQQFYMPSVLIPIKDDALPDATNYTYTNGIFTIDLFNIYKKQYGTPQVKSLSYATLSYAMTADAFDYFILYYDPSVFTSLAVSAAGILSYSLVDGHSVSEKTFMNIMFKEK